jgi:hypothetical protein
MVSAQLVADDDLARSEGRGEQVEGDGATSRPLEEHAGQKEEEPIEADEANDVPAREAEVRQTRDDPHAIVGRSGARDERLNRVGSRRGAGIASRNNAARWKPGTQNPATALWKISQPVGQKPSAAIAAIKPANNGWSTRWIAVVTASPDYSPDPRSYLVGG